MSFTGVVRLFRATPQGSIGDGGRMALADHLRELRARLMRSLLVFIVLLVAALFFYEPILDAVITPYTKAVDKLGQDVESNAYIKGAGGPLLLQLKLCGLAAVVLSSPYWLYQVWAFIVPGLHAHEKKWSKIFMGIAGPLFFAGVATGYYVLPKGLEVLIGFTPDRLQNLVEFGEYFSFFTRMLLIFGISFEIPLFVVLLNLAGVLPAKVLAEYRSWIVIGVFAFAAVATPSTDPFSMIMLAVPMTILFFASELIARLTDKRRRLREEDNSLGDDEATPDDQL